MKRPITAALVLAGTLALSTGAYATDAENTGQDPTAPVTRVDLRVKYKQAPDTEIFTLRADRPFALGPKWKLSTRFDVPFVRNDVPSGDNTAGEYETGLSDILVQALLIAPAKGPWTVAFGGQMIFPTAIEDQMGTGKWQIVPTAVVIKQLPHISPGTFAGVLVREQISFAGDDTRQDINDLVIQPLFNINLKKAWFVTIAPEARINLDHKAQLFLPADITIGKKVNPRTVVSLTWDAAIVDDYEQYDWQMEARVGVFF